MFDKGSPGESPVRKAKSLKLHFSNHGGLAAENILFVNYEITFRLFNLSVAFVGESKSGKPIFC